MTAFITAIAVAAAGYLPAWTKPPKRRGAQVILACVLDYMSKDQICIYSDVSGNCSAWVQEKKEPWRKVLDGTGYLTPEGFPMCRPDPES